MQGVTLVTTDVLLVVQRVALDVVGLAFVTVCIQERV